MKKDSETIVRFAPRLLAAAVAAFVAATMWLVFTSREPVESLLELMRITLAWPSLGAVLAVLLAYLFREQIGERLRDSDITAETPFGHFKSMASGSDAQPAVEVDAGTATITAAQLGTYFVLKNLTFSDVSAGSWGQFVYKLGQPSSLYLLQDESQYTYWARFNDLSDDEIVIRLAALARNLRRADGQFRESSNTEAKKTWEQWVGAAIMVEIVVSDTANVAALENAARQIGESIRAFRLRTTTDPGILTKLQDEARRWTAE